MSSLEFRDPALARELTGALAGAVAQVGHVPVSVMHVCGSHEQAIARFGLRATLPRDLQVIMGPGCPVCITDMPEIDEAIALALSGVRIATYGDMLRVPGTAGSLADRYSKRSVIVACKVAEIVLMLLGTAAIISLNPWFLFAVVMLMGAQSALFGPAKFGSLPEMLLIARSSTPTISSTAPSIISTMPRIATDAGTRRRVMAWNTGAQMTAMNTASRNGTMMLAAACRPAITTMNAAAVRR